MATSQVNVINNINNISILNLVTVTPSQSPSPSPTKKQVFKPSNPPVSTKKTTNNKAVTIKVGLEFPQDVNIEGLSDINFDIMQLTDFYDLMFAYNIVNSKGLYQGIKDKNYRWVFFSDEYEVYDKEESKELIIEPVFNEKWYRGKFMTVYLLGNDFKYGKYILPTTKQEYDEDRVLYQGLYQMMRKNNSLIGKVIKNKKPEC